MALNYPVPLNEAERLAALRDTGILGPSKDPQFDAVVALACDLFDVPISLVTLLDEHRQWFKAARGVDLCSTDRKSAFCNDPVASGTHLVVHDTWLDPRFKSNPFVVSAPNIRFYAGVPLKLTEDISLGTLCVLDAKPRPFSDDQLARLQRMGDIVVALIKQHRDSRLVADLAAHLELKNRLIKRQTDALNKHKGLFERASVLTKMGAWEWHPDSDHLVWTDGMYDLHEMPRGSKVSWQQVRTMYLMPGRSELEKLYAKSNHDSAGFTFEGSIVTAKGNKRWIRLTVDVECEAGTVVRRFGVKQDITEQKILWDRMQDLAETDPLTGLSNRGHLQKYLARSADRRSIDRTTLYLIDLDGFKDVNDTFGHTVGDECLKQMARRLKRLCGEADVVARLGGDEFAVLFKSIESHDRVEAIARDMLTLLRRPVRWQGQSFQLGGSIGIANCLNRDDEFTGLITEADLALYACKSSGRNTYKVFEPHMKLEADIRFETISNIDQALRTNRLEIFFQPKVNLVDERISGFEALVRWRRPDGQIIPAGQFSAAFSDPDLSARIGEWVIEAVVDRASQWVGEGVEFGHIAININSAQCENPTFAHRLLARMAAHGLSSRMIEVEVTEGVLLHKKAGRIGETFRVLREAGIRIALDDFGTGYASLVHLRTYPVDIIKIDKSFVQRCLTSVADHAIVQATLFLARHLNLDVVAEGIEHQDQRDFLKALGCQIGQGFLFSQALDVNEARQWCLPYRADGHKKYG